MSRFNYEPAYFARVPPRPMSVPSSWRRRPRT